MNIVAMVLAGGEGTRLYPLTAEHAKPAVPFASGYRLVDFVLSNLVNAGFAAKLEGAVVITDGVAELVELDAAVQGSVQLGDVTLTGATLKLRSTYGSTLDISFTGGLKVGSRADLNGAVNASFGPNGSLLSLTGNMEMTGRTFFMKLSYAWTP